MNTPAPESARPTSQQAEWVQRPERSNGAMLRLMTWISLRLGRTPARFILSGISLYFLVFSPAAKDGFAHLSAPGARTGTQIRRPVPALSQLCLHHS